MNFHFDHIMSGFVDVGLQWMGFAQMEKLPSMKGYLYPGAYGKGGHGVTVTPMASDSKWCRTVNLQEKKGKRGKERKQKK